MEFAKEWASLILSLMAIATTLWTLITSSSKGAHKRIDKLEEARANSADTIVTRFQQTESRLLTLESDIKHLPEREQVHRIEIAVERLSGRLETLDERLKPVAAVAMRLQEFELERASSK